MTSRRGFLGAILAAAAAPAFVRAEILMPVRKLVLPPDPLELVHRLGSTTVWAPPGSLRVGDLFTIAGVLGVDQLRQHFEVTEVVTSSGGIITLQVSP